VVCVCVVCVFCVVCVGLRVACFVGDGGQMWCRRDMRVLVICVVCVCVC
jgi:hypothetical protein